eukprot:TRINITY_DN3038_c0_g1_i1.p1 TRINITY_DN3038_c0_g1~~TRINITY_DN3038_c0_g1_i1.p1  ORF type:complete len:133 (+),score=12.22 TRINITY_DN3038_c0_g1_i1:597-995(+)
MVQRRCTVLAVALQLVLTQAVRDLAGTWYATSTNCYSLRPCQTSCNAAYTVTFSDINTFSLTPRFVPGCNCQSGVGSGTSTTFQSGFIDLRLSGDSSTLTVVAPSRWWYGTCTLTYTKTDVLCSGCHIAAVS